MTEQQDSYRESHRDKGEDYHDSFVRIPHRAMMWRLERRALLDIAGRAARRRDLTHLDFACGTGRVLAALESLVSHSTGVDVSASMLDVARSQSPDAEILQADLTQGDVLAGRVFDIVTAFRFFPKAEADLRLAAVQALSRHLADDGVLIFNNHKQAGSLVQRVARLAGRGDIVTMSHAEVEDLVSAAKLTIVDTIPLGLFPVSERWTFVPVSLLEILERLLSLLPGIRPLAQNVIYVCRKG